MTTLSQTIGLSTSLQDHERDTVSVYMSHLTTVLEEVLRWIDVSPELNPQVARVSAQSFGRAVPISWVDISVPKVRRFYNVHIRVKYFEAIFRHRKDLQCRGWIFVAQ